MTIFQEILRWSKTIPAWQSDAIARLLAKQKLDEQDLDDLYALLKAAHGIADEAGRTARPLSEDQIPVPVAPTTQVVLHAIKNLKHVNAIATVRMPVAQTGLTVIYGDNGSGKSGYTRVLKRACRARDQAERILPNANIGHSNSPLPEAEFEISVAGGEPQTIRWTLGSAAPAALSSLSIFDSRCARAYLDHEDDFSYVPYGLDVFQGLVRVCGDLKSRLEAGIQQHGTDLTAFAGLNGETAVGGLIRGLSHRTNTEDVERLGTLTEPELKRHAEVDKSLKETNPRERAVQLRAQSQRIRNIAANALAKAASVNEDAVQGFRALSDTYRRAKAAAEVAAKAFKESDRLLPGTGGEAWRELFEAARKFAIESHEGHEFPELGDGAQCPLCQQTLDDGAARLQRFQKFIEEEAAKNAQNARRTLYAAYQPFTTLDLNVGLDDVTYGEIEALEQGLGAAVRSFVDDLRERQQAIKTSIERNVWTDLVPVRNPAERLSAIADRFASQAQTLDGAADQKARDALAKEHAELAARIRLSEVKAAVVTAVQRMAYQTKLKACSAALRTHSITTKSAEIAEKVISVELARALNEEFRVLGVGALRVSLKSRGDKGRALHKLKLELPQSVSPGDILSEGEQRAIAIGCFLAEIGLGGGRGGIIFDDPVSSLDHRRRERVARRLVAEAARRQVIIFTHDIYFLSILEEAARASSTPIFLQSLNRRPEGFGVPEEQLPFEGMSSVKRIGALKAMHQDIRKVYESGDEPAHRRMTADAYFRLRMSWERAVEEVLLRGVVLRFRKSIETNRLAEVSVDDGDYHAISQGMTKCSNYAHDKAMAGGIAMPEPDEILSDIKALEDWRAATEERSKATRAARRPRA